MPIVDGWGPWQTMTDPRYTRGTASRNVVQPQWIIWVGVAFFLAGILVLVGWRQMRNDPTDVQLALKNIDERLGRIDIAERGKGPASRLQYGAGSTDRGLR